MKHKKLYNCFKTLALIVMVGVQLSLHSCSLVFEDSFEEEDNSYILFTLSVPSLTETKAGSGDGYDDGTLREYENYIDLKNSDFRIYIFGNDGSILAPIPPEDVVIAPLSSKTYNLVAKISYDAIPQETPFKVTFVSNWGTYPENVENMSDLSKSTISQNIYNFSSSWSLGTNFIPMFGTTNLLTDKVLEREKVTDVGTIHLLRAMAKVDVISADDEVDIDYVEIVNYNTKGLCAPIGVTTQDDYFKTANSHDKNYWHSVSLPGGVNTPYRDYGLKFKNDKANPAVEGHSCHWLYIPEYKNVGESVISYMNVKFTGDNRIYRLDFKAYTQNAADDMDISIGEPFDVLRNDYYRFVVRRNALDLSLIVELVPYSQVVLEPVFGFEDLKYAE